MASDVVMYAQGQTATFTAQFVTSPAGMPIDVPDATIEIFGESAIVILAATPMVYVMTGFYFYDYILPVSLPVGVYTVRISGTVLGVPTAMTIYLQVVPAGVVTPASASQQAVEFVAALGSYISSTMRIPVYRELARTNKNRNIFQLTWPRWNMGNHQIRLNNEIIDDGYTMDIDNGNLTFTIPLQPSDRVEASYNFRWFTQIDLIRFISDAINQINVEPPFSSWTIDNLPEQYVGVALIGASKNALRRLLLDLAFQEPATVFGTPARAKDAISTFQALKENNEKEFAADKATLKTRGPYPKISAVVQPEYTLPGCLVPSTTVYISTYGNMNVSELHMLSRTKKPLFVLSNTLIGNKFARVGNVWETGIKRIFRLETTEGRMLEASEKHLIFSNGAYKPLSVLNKGENLITTEGLDRIKRIVRTKRFIQMYDMEVPSTQNLFANGIQCHNSRSRWFRYLFSGGMS